MKKETKRKILLYAGQTVLAVLGGVVANEIAKSDILKELEKVKALPNSKDD